MGSEDKPNDQLHLYTVELSNFIAHCFEHPQVLTQQVFQDMKMLCCLLSRGKAAHDLWTAWDWIIPGSGEPVRYYETMSAAIAMEIPPESPEGFETWGQWLIEAAEQTLQPGLYNTYEQAHLWRTLATRIGLDNARQLARDTPHQDWGEMLTSYDEAFLLQDSVHLATHEAERSRL